MAKLLLTQVFGMSVVELYAGKDTTFSVNEPVSYTHLSMLGDAKIILWAEPLSTTAAYPFCSEICFKMCIRDSVCNVKFAIVRFCASLWGQR